MQSNRDNPCNYVWSIFNKTISFIQYPLKHPCKTIFYLLCLGAATQQLRSMFGKSDDVIKYPIDSVHMTYRGPSVFYRLDYKFNQTRDLIGWATDRHPNGIFTEDGWHHVTSSFNLDDVPDNEKEALLERRYSFYNWAYLKSNAMGHCNILSHRGCMGDMQSTFGFYGYPNIQKLEKDYRVTTKQGFIVGIRAFGNEDYYSMTNNKTVYQLAKIDLGTIDLDKINFEHNNSPAKIAHVYLRNGEVQEHPDIEYKDKWSPTVYENYIKNLPNFSETVDWVISSSDLPLALEGKPVVNLMDHKEINILEWQSKQQKKSQQPLEKYSLFSLRRPSDYDSSYERDEITGQYKRKPPILFKIGKKD